MPYTQSLNPWDPLFPVPTTDPSPGPVTPVPYPQNPRTPLGHTGEVCDEHGVCVSIQLCL